MPLRIAYCPYRLLFKHPFATAHGVRDGTDSIFIRLEEDGAVGYGEVTLPPYLREKPRSVVERLEAIGRMGLPDGQALAALLDDPAVFPADAQGCRAGLQMAWMDLLGYRYQLPVSKLLDVSDLKRTTALLTIGISAEAELIDKLRELPASKALKVKVKNAGSVAVLKALWELDERLFFLDANQGLGSVEEALVLIDAAGDRLLAMEQPFPVDRPDLQEAFARTSGVLVYGDESIQGPADMDEAARMFGGVNVKLMKCGGLDRAKAMIDRAERSGMAVMLGSMSESSLGCTAMAHLIGQADIADLDGPWLIRNDPFTGVGWQQGGLVVPDRPGIGAVLQADLDLRSICA